MFSRVRAIAVGVVGVMAASALALGAPLAANAAGTASISGTVTLPAGVTVSGSHLRISVYDAADVSGDEKYAADASVDSGFPGTFPIGADGSYSITGVEPGDYKVFFSTYDANVALEWWQDADDLEDAETISLSDSEAFVANATLDAGATISGRVTGGIVAQGYGWVLAFRQTADGMVNEGWANIAPDGRYTVEGLRPGTYTFLFSDYGGYGDYPTVGMVTGWAEWWEDAMSADAATTVSVTRQAALTGYDVNLDTVGGQSTWPVVSGTPKVGYTLTTTAGPWPAGTTLQYRWFANGQEIIGANSSKLVLTAAQYGKYIEAGVFGVKPGQTNIESKFSALTGKVVAGTLKASTPKISGTAKVGKKLTAKPGVWTSGTKFTYRWYANGKAIKKATKSTFKVTSAQRGKKITVKVTGTKAGYTTVAKVSAKTKKVKR